MGGKGLRGERGKGISAGKGGGEDLREEREKIWGKKGQQGKGGKIYGRKREKLSGGKGLRRERVGRISTGTGGKQS